MHFSAHFIYLFKHLCSRPSFHLLVLIIFPPYMIRNTVSEVLSPVFPCFCVFFYIVLHCSFRQVVCLTWFNLIVFVISCVSLILGSIIVLSNDFRLQLLLALRLFWVGQYISYNTWVQIQSSTLLLFNQPCIHLSFWLKQVLLPLCCFKEVVKLYMKLPWLTILGELSWHESQIALSIRLRGFFVATCRFSSFVCSLESNTYAGHLKGADGLSASLVLFRSHFFWCLIYILNSLSGVSMHPLKRYIIPTKISCVRYCGSWINGDPQDKDPKV